ncbi:TPA: hypothetical protein ACX6Q6_003027 [Photobacterium damselae]
MKKALILSAIVISSLSGCHRMMASHSSDWADLPIMERCSNYGAAMAEGEKVIALKIERNLEAEYKKNPFDFDMCKANAQQGYGDYLQAVQDDKDVGRAMQRFDASVNSDTRVMIDSF